jgi:hypothetical protein
MKNGTSFHRRDFFPVEPADERIRLSGRSKAEPAPPVLAASGEGPSDFLEIASADKPGTPIPRAPTKVRDWAMSVGLIIPGKQYVPCAQHLDPPKVLTPLLEDTGEGFWWLHAGTAGQVHDLCRRTLVNRSFYHRPASWAGRLGCAATGFLLRATGTGGERLLLTTLHSVAGLITPGADSNYVVFGFTDAIDNGWGVCVNKVYKINKVYARGTDVRDERQDWALLEVDRTTGGLPDGLDLAATPPGEDDELVIISHSLGLPKSWGRGKIFDTTAGAFSHTCDTLGGSSGAPLLDWRRPERGVVGMCVRGGHLRSTPTGGSEPIPIGDPTEPFFGANRALSFDAPGFPKLIPPKGQGLPGTFANTWPDKFPIRYPTAAKKKTVQRRVRELAESGTGARPFPLMVGEDQHVVTLGCREVMDLYWGKAVRVLSKPPRKKCPIEVTIRPW